MTRISDSMQYGNTYPINEVMTDLTDAIFEGDISSSVNLVRQSLQAFYIDNLIYLLNDSQETDYQARAAILTELQRLEGLLSGKRSGDGSTRAHTNFILFTIKQGLDSGA